ncbi:hypothetical protein CERSUDRAFT_75404 [Gelatoporia subvermispora B]|uniref:Uncharacterized protein n=1 Tax=Ceriporiopsis subvermispora (strain B) TaxID=914234 RepID=M2R8R0_CERS8|nr:hypothetical protein CERSUDRAFT_75404 [Gelatoporia subvermispora B]
MKKINNGSKSIREYQFMRPLSTRTFSSQLSTQLTNCPDAPPVWGPILSLRDLENINNKLSQDLSKTLMVVTKNINMLAGCGKLPPSPGTPLKLATAQDIKSEILRNCHRKMPSATFGKDSPPKGLEKPYNYMMTILEDVREPFNCMFEMLETVSAYMTMTMSSVKAISKHIEGLTGS